MTPERFRQIRNLFQAAQERETSARASFLDEACRGDELLRAEVGQLLGAHKEEFTLLDQGVRPELLSGERGRLEGRRIDHYEILRELGRGGMGAVYLAVRTDDVYRKPVALKVVRQEATRETIERFRQEREILAALEHPNLARLLDGGTTPEGLPYFVMDYIDGQAIDQYCDERQLNIAQRMELFRSVCGAVEYAHCRGVIHRDLKPGNILVTGEGVVKLLDFGIAKLLRTGPDEPTAHITRTGMYLMTPEYASPEQVRGGPVGVASDIYSLGVVLYELLTGHRPYRMTSRLIHEVARVICEEEPVRPSTAVTTTEERQIGGEDKPLTVTPESVSRTRAASPEGLRRLLSDSPDNIVLKAIQKEPRERYRTVEELSEDLRRYREGMPVLARGRSLAYRAENFLNRHRSWAIGVVALGAGFSTGIINVKGQALSIGLSIGLLWGLGLQYLAVRGVVGHKTAMVKLTPALVLAAICSSIVFAVEFTMKNPILNSLGNKYVFLLKVVAPSGTAEEVQTSALWLLVPVFFWMRWLFRGRWAGPVLVDLKPHYESSRSKLKAGACFAAGLIAAFLIFFAGTSWLGLPSKVSPHVSNGFLAFCGFWAGSCFQVIPATMLLCRTEIRQRGIVRVYSVVRWRNVESFVWETADAGLLVLRLRVKRSIPFFPWRLIVVPAAQKNATETILSQQLADSIPDR